MYFQADARYRVAVALESALCWDSDSTPEQQWELENSSMARLKRCFLRRSLSSQASFAWLFLFLIGDMSRKFWRKNPWHIFSWKNGIWYFNDPSHICIQHCPHLWEHVTTHPMYLSSSCKRSLLLPVSGIFLEFRWPLLGFTLHLLII